MSSDLGRLYVVSQEPDTQVVERLIQAARCGADIIQIRSKKTKDEKLLETIDYIKDNIPENVVIIVNDYPEIAIMAGVHGIHGGISDFGLEEIKIFKEKYNIIVGVSVYDSLKRAQIAEKYGADYVAFSSPFPSPSKEKVLTPHETIEKAAKTLNTPVFVIGGITSENAEEVLELGVHGIAVMSYAFSGNTCERIKKLKSLVEKYAAQ